MVVILCETCVVNNTHFLHTIYICKLRAYCIQAYIMNYNIRYIISLSRVEFFKKKKINRFFHNHDKLPIRKIIVHYIIF